MSFRLPQFNIRIGLWYPPAAPPAAPSHEIDGQLRIAGRQSTGQDSTNAGWPFLSSLLAPKGSDLRDTFNAPGDYYAEAPLGSGRLYRIVLVDDVAKGFDNEYRIAYITKIGTWPVPIP